MQLPRLNYATSGHQKFTEETRSYYYPTVKFS